MSNIDFAQHDSQHQPDHTKDLTGTVSFCFPNEMYK